MISTDENFEELVANWAIFRDKFVIFLGAGASIGAKNRDGDELLNAYELRNSLWEKFKHADKSLPFDPADLKLMSLEHAAAIIESQTGRRAISDYLVQLFRCDRPLWQHAVLPTSVPNVFYH